MQAWRLSLLAILSLETDGLAYGNEGDNERLRALDRVWRALFKVYSTKINDKLMNVIDDTGKRKTMRVSGCGGDALRFGRGQPARGSESLPSGHLASETFWGDTGREGHGCWSSGLPHWRTWHTHNVPCWATESILLAERV